MRHLEETQSRKTHSPCPRCDTSGVDPLAPVRRTETGKLMFLLKACTACEGHGVIHNGADKNLLLQDVV